MSRIELLEFWATGCRASTGCHRAVAELAWDPRFTLDVRSIDAWDAPLEVATHRVVALPTLLLLVDGTERARCSPHAASAEGLASWVAAALSGLGLTASARPPARV